MDNWLRHLQDVRQKHRERLPGVSQEEQCDRLCELNVIDQVANVCHTSIAREAWERGQELSIHGWVYGLQNGLLKDLKVTVSDFSEFPEVYDGAVAALSKNPGESAP